MQACERDEWSLEERAFWQGVKGKGLRELFVKKKKKRETARETDPRTSEGNSHRGDSIVPFFEETTRGRTR